MAEPFETPHVNIQGMYEGEDKHGHNYIFTNTLTGDSRRTSSDYGPEDTTNKAGDVLPGLKSLMGRDFNTPPGLELGTRLAPVFMSLQEKDRRNFLQRAVLPLFRSIPAYIVGGPWDMASLLSYVPSPEVGAGMVYEAITGDELEFVRRDVERKEAFRKEVHEDLGIEATRRNFQYAIRQADLYFEDKFGFKPFEDVTGTDMTPEARDIWGKMITTGLEFALSGPLIIKGATLPAKLGQELAAWGVPKATIQADLIVARNRAFAKLAKTSVLEKGEDALNPENIRSLVDQANDYISMFTAKGRRNIRAETTFGGAAGVYTEASLAGLEEIDPKASGLVKALVAAVGGIAGPVGTRSALTGFLALPAIKVVSAIAIDPLFRPERAAARFSKIYGMGAGRRGRAEIASVARLLEEAVQDGRHLDQAAGLAFTTPELSRTEANILRARYQIKHDQLMRESDPKIKKQLEKELEQTEKDISLLTRYANFQESVLISASRDQSAGVAARFLEVEATRLIERREGFFNYIQNQFKKSFDDINFGGKEKNIDGSNVTPEQLRIDYDNAKLEGGMPEFEVTRRKLVMEGDPKGVEPSELRFLTPKMSDQVAGVRNDLTEHMAKALADAESAAAGRVKFWKDNVKSYLADRGYKTVDELSDVERKFVGDLIRDTYNDARREFRAFEKAAYGLVRGIDRKVTENIVFPKGSRDPVTGEDITGMEVSAWAAGRLENLTPAQQFNPRDVPVQLAQLAGMNSVQQILRKRQAAADAAAAGGKAQGRAETRISDLEGTRDTAIAKRQKVEKEVDDQLELDRVAAENQTRTLQRYIDENINKLDPERRFKNISKSIDDFINDPTINWQAMTPEVARGLVPSGTINRHRKALESIFASVAQQKKKIAALGQGTEASAKVSKLRGEIDKHSQKAQGAQDKIDQITRRFLGDVDDAPIEAAGRLSSRNAEGELVREGISAQDVNDVISELTTAAREEMSRSGGRSTPLHKALTETQITLQQLVSPTTFPDLDTRALSFAKEATQVKRRVDEAHANLLAKDKEAGTKVPVEEAAEKALPPTAAASKQASALRLLRTATAEVPPFVTIKRDAAGKVVLDADGIPIAVIDESAVSGGSLLSHPDSPFERIVAGEGMGGFSEIRLKPNAPVTDRSLDLAEKILVERLALQFPDGVNSKSLEAFRSKNKQAVEFLETNGRQTVPKMLKDADTLAQQLDSLNALFQDKTRRQVTELVNSGALDLGANTIDDFLQYIQKRRERLAETNSFGEVIRAEPGYATNSLFDKLLDPNNKQPKKELYEFLSVVRGDEAAERGFKAAVIGELWRRSTTKMEGLGGNEALIRQVGDISATAFDPARFRELLADPKIRMLLQEVFPDNGQLLKGLDEMAKVAFETANFTRGGRSLAGKVNPEGAFSQAAWSTLGRIMGLQLADKVGFINALVASGWGATTLVKVGKSVTGVAIKDIVIGAALDPVKAVKLAQTTKDQMQSLARSFIQGTIETINVPGKMLQRPAVITPVLKRGEEELRKDEQDRLQKESSNLQERRNAAAARLGRTMPVQSSVLSRVNPMAPPSTPVAPQGTSQPDTVARMEQFGLPLFAANGGIASIKPKKPRQMVI